MYWKIYGQTGERFTLLGRGLGTLKIGEVLLMRCTEYDRFRIELDPDFEAEILPFMEK